MNLLGLIDIPGWLIIVLGLTYAYYRYMTWYSTFFDELGIKYAPNPVISAAWNMMTKGITQFDMDGIKQNGKVFGSFQGRKPALFVADPEMLKEIMVKQFHIFPNRQAFDVIDSPIDKMVLFLRDDQWKRVRALLSPTFSGSKMRRMMMNVNRCAGDFADSMVEKAEAGGVVDVWRTAGNYTMDVIASTAFGIQINSQKEPNSPFVKHARNAFVSDVMDIRLVILFFFPFLVKHMGKLNMSLFPKASTEFFSSVVKSAIHSRESDPNQEDCTDFLQLMINAHTEDPGSNGHEKAPNGDVTSSAKAGLTEDEILGQALIFFFAGYETTAVTISYLAYNLATNPECQEKLLQEIDDVTEGHDVIDYDLVKKMPYLTQCMDETLRLFPAGVRVDRMASQATTVKGVPIPKDLIINIPIYAIHYDPEYWPNPEKFDPERFTSEAKAARDPYVYLPFGIGPRSCVGMRLAILEVKAAMATILRRLKFATCPETEIPPQKVSAGIRAKNGIKLKVISR